MRYGVPYLYFHQFLNSIFIPSSYASLVSDVEEESSEIVLKLGDSVNVSAELRTRIYLISGKIRISSKNDVLKF